MTSTRTSIYPGDPVCPRSDDSVHWVEQMARRFYRAPDDIRDLVSATVDQIDPEIAHHGCDEQYRHSALSIMRDIVMARYKSANGRR
jgi:hypothetical protein